MGPLLRLSKSAFSKSVNAIWGASGRLLLRRRPTIGEGYRPTTQSDGQPTDKVNFDLWYNPTIGTFYDVLNALDDLGHDTARVRAMERIDPKKSYLRFKSEYYAIDFLPALEAVGDYKKALAKAEFREIVGVDPYLLS